MEIQYLKKIEGQEGIDALFLYATEGILVVNEVGIITRINPSAEKLFAYEKGELLGKKIEVLVPSRFGNSHANHRHNYSQNPNARSMGVGLELYGLKKDGVEFPVEISLSPFSNSEGKFVIAFIVDYTLRRQAEEKLKNYSAELERQVKNRTLILEEAIEELEKTKRNLNKALEKEKDLNELKSRFVSMASHEFRTPLTTMMSSLSLVSKYGELKDTENQNKHINKIKGSIKLLTDILNDFLSLSKLEAGKIEYSPEQSNIKQFISTILEDMKSLVPEGQIIRQAHTGDELVKIDKKLLQHILFNLVSNAIKYSPDKKPIEIESEVNSRELKISVKDEGIGISKEDQKHLFERFFRGQNAIHIQGTGLGLNIVAGYVELMNGTIGFNSEENKGTVFMLTVPQ